ncbi:MAG: hypothetical protein JWM62_1999 [Frankiales bacterium]|jgi:hypothetical protein|nr:hypothetical protein [Frankiales bacterium]
MSVQDTLHTVTIPSQAAPADPPLAPAAAAPAPAARLVGVDRPLDADERMFVFGLGATFAVLAALLVTFLLLAEYVW